MKGLVGFASFICAWSGCSRGATRPPPSQDAGSNALVTMNYSASGADVRSIRVTIPHRDRAFEIELDPRRNRESIVSLESGDTAGHSVVWEGGKVVALGVTGELGKPNGVFHAFHDDGAIMAENEYRNGERHGRMREWFPSGQLRRVGAYERNWPVGEWTQYFAEGGVQEITEYFPRSSDLGDLQRPRHRRRRCSAAQPLVDVVVDGKAVPNTDCK